MEVQRRQLFLHQRLTTISNIISPFIYVETLTIQSSALRFNCTCVKIYGFPVRQCLFFKFHSIVPVYCSSLSRLQFCLIPIPTAGLESAHWAQDSALKLSRSQGSAPLNLERLNTGLPETGSYVCIPETSTNCKWQQWQPVTHLNATVNVSWAHASAFSETDRPRHHM